MGVSYVFLVGKTGTAAETPARGMRVRHRTAELRRHDAGLPASLHDTNCTQEATWGSFPYGRISRHD